MARPQKDGLDYFPFDVDFFEDEKVEAISGEFGIKGEIIVVRLLCAIYHKGYFVEWNELLKMKLTKRLTGVSPELLETVVKRLVMWEFFNKALFDSASILTSMGIQKRYAEASKRRKSDKCLQYWLLNGVNVYNNPVSDDINVDINPQSKVKESKVNESKGDVITSPQQENSVLQFDLSKSNLYRQPRIPTIQEVERVFVQSGGTLEMAKKFFEKNDAVGWFHNNSPIVKWQNFVQGYISSWRKNENNGKDQPSAKKLQGRIDYSRAL